MTAASDDIAGLLVQKGIATLRVSQGEILSWDPETLKNEILWREVRLEDVPVQRGVSALGYQSGDTVILLGADVAGKRGMTQWWILGPLAVPGEDSPDVVIRGSNVNVQGGSISVIDATGNVRVQIDRGENGGGQLVTYHPNGEAHMAVGFITAESGGEAGQGLVVQQDNGQDIFNAFPNSVTGNNQFRMWDHEGNQVWTTDKNGFGIDRPYMDVPMYHQNSTGDIRVGGTDFSTIWMGRLRYTHPALHAQVRAWVSTDDSTVPEGEIRLMVAGQQVGSTQTVDSETSSFFDFGSSVHDLAGLGMVYNEFQVVEIQGRISADAGTEEQARLLSVLAYGVTKRGSA